MSGVPSFLNTLIGRSGTSVLNAKILLIIHILFIEMIFRTQIGLASKDSTSPVTILERSLFSERYCFVQVHRLLCWNHYFIIILDATGVWGYNTRGVCPSWPVVPHPDQPCYHWHGGGPDHLHQEWSRYPHGQDQCKRTAGEIVCMMNITFYYSY